MIAINIEDTTVLRRTLEEIEATIPKLEYSISAVSALPEGASVEEVVLKINEIIVGYNKIVNTLNKPV